MIEESKHKMVMEKLAIFCSLAFLFLLTELREAARSVCVSQLTSVVC